MPTASLPTRTVAYRVMTKSLDPMRVRVGEIMVKPLIVVNPNLRLPFIAQLFANTNIQNAPVIEEHTLVGIISTCDLAHALVSDESRTREITSRRKYMDFGWSKEEEMWRRTVRDFAQKKIAPRSREIDSSGRHPR